MKYETINGNPARIICYDMKSVTHPIVALIEDITSYIGGGKSEYSIHLTKDLKLSLSDKEPYLIEVDSLRDMKRVKSEGARIEAYINSGRWEEKEPLAWNLQLERYRILDGISIESWDAHKDVIKAFWEGAEIEWECNDGLWFKSPIPTWGINVKYRVKPTTKRVTLKEVAKMYNVDHIEIVEEIK